MAIFKIMIVEDDPAVRALSSEALAKWGFEVSAPSPEGDVAAEFARSQPHLVILDVGLPRLDGYEWCARIREVSKAPILFLSARSHPADAVRGLAGGGDDWLTKPFDVEVLVARVKALLRRAYSWAAEATTLLEREGLVLDREGSRASLDGKSVALTRNEALLLRRLLERGGRVVSRDELQDALWSEDAFVDDNTLTVNMSRLKSALDEIGAKDRIETLRGAGYRLK